MVTNALRGGEVMAKRLNEFCTAKYEFSNYLSLCAWATYKRGDVPDVGEFEYINKRVTDKYPGAELRQMKRIPVPTGDVAIPFTEVKWEFEWVVYNYNKKARC
jgi:hypothetical protein